MTKTTTTLPATNMFGDLVLRVSFLTILLCLTPTILIAEDCYTEAKAFVEAKDTAAVDSSQQALVGLAKNRLETCLDADDKPNQITTVGQRSIFSGQSDFGVARLAVRDTKSPFMCSQDGKCYKIEVEGGKPVFRTIDNVSLETQTLDADGLGNVLENSWFLGDDATQFLNSNQSIEFSIIGQ